jgi:hypothetical protein
MTISIQDVSVIQKRVNFKGGFFEYQKNESGQRVKDHNGNVIFSNIAEDNTASDFTEAVSALNALSKVISTNNRKIQTSGRTSPLKGRKLGPRKAKEVPANQVQ